MTKTDSKLMIWALGSHLLVGCSGESPTTKTHEVNIETVPVENGAPTLEEEHPSTQPVDAKEAPWSPPNPSEIWDNYGVSETISMGTPIFESPHQIAIAYGTFKTSEAIGAWALKQQERLKRMGWHVAAQWSDESNHAFRIHRNEETLCAFYIPSSTESSLVIYEQPGSHAILGDCIEDSSIPQVTLADIESKKRTTQEVLKRWHDRGIITDAPNIVVLDIQDDQLRYTSPAPTEKADTHGIIHPATRALTESGWLMEAEGQSGEKQWSWWSRKQERVCLHIGPADDGTPYEQIQIDTISTSAATCESQLGQ